MEPSVRCETRNLLGQCVPTRAHQSRNSQTLITGSTESHRLLLYQASLTEVKQQTPGTGKVVLSVSDPHTRHVERKCHGPTSPNLLFQDPGRCTGPALQASVIVISQDTVTATHTADTFMNHEPADRLHPNSQLPPSTPTWVISGFKHLQA